MNEFINTINWSETWIFLKQYILPNIGWLVFWIVLFILIGLAISIVLNIYLYKKKYFNRDRKYYNWIAKLWIPYIILVCLYFFGMFGFIYGCHIILDKENTTITTNIYSKTIGPAFSSEENKKEFLASLQKLMNSSEDASKSLSQSLALYIEKNNSGIATVDNFKNSSSNYLLQKYESEIFSATAYGLIKTVDSKVDIANIKNVDYSQFKSLLTKLDKIKSEQIEKSIQLEMGLKVKNISDYFYKGIMKHEVLFYLLFMSFPFIEYLIYLKFYKTKKNSEPIDSL
ncbi:hypothetical protein LNQ49_05930 [Flavobacterium sp. F-65]|uniref:Uncharacterized protein n=1 Tax=Flavobacterium pisciphilum TaxID=2893755 RepID=A0ABS8MTC4_9FLAO|nr:hypothetical protein [Flavobacterium sp. F-65]MCC9071130.1 hypothetical protein [Flavobacterium sp. F-65]